MAEKGSKAWTAGIIVVCFALAISIAVNSDVIDCDYYRFKEIDSGVFV